MKRRAARRDVTSNLEARRGCEWDGRPMPKHARAGHRFCSQRCRQAAQRFRVDAAGATPSGRAIRFAYADPPYPGCARRYYGKREVDHGALVVRLIREYPDGFAISTRAKSLPYVLSLIPLALGPRVLIWDRKASRRGVAYKSRNRWEPVIIVGGRVRRVELDEDLDDILEWGGRQRTHPGALMGMKPAAFWEWLFRQMGAQRDDAFDDIFPGSGAGARAWRMYTTPPDAISASRRRRPSRYAASTKGDSRR